MIKTFPKDVSKKIYIEFVEDIDEFKTNSKEKINKYRNEIYDFIRDTFDEYDYKRCMCHNIIFRVTEEVIIRLIHLKNLIDCGCCNMDKESNITFSRSGFCFDNDTNLVIFNNR